MSFNNRTCFVKFYYKWERERERERSRWKDRLDNLSDGDSLFKERDDQNALQKQNITCMQRMIEDMKFRRREV